MAQGAGHKAQENCETGGKSKRGKKTLLTA
jgi:hypothetical protein